MSFAKEYYVFTPINANSGLSDNKIRNIVQLPDGRMMITTEGLINLYDGTSFNYLHYNNNVCNLSGYTGFHHEYVNDEYIWLKNNHQLMIIDINKEQFVGNPQLLLNSLGFNQPLSDFFMDREQNLWVITEEDNLLCRNSRKKDISTFRSNISRIENTSDQVYDLAVTDNQLFLFYQSGLLICYDVPSRKELYRTKSLTEEYKRMYGATSFVMQGNNSFFQLRNGVEGGIMLVYDIKKKIWDTLLQTDYWLNYLSIDASGDIWVSCRDGLWHINADLSEKQFISTLKLVDGSVIHTEVSTLYHDKQGGLWLGTLNRGILYYHPNRFKIRNIGHILFPLTKEITINISGFSEDQDGKILVGTRQGVFVYNEKNGVILQHPQKILSELPCNALFKDSKQRIWIATNGKGLYCIEANGQLRHVTVPCNTIYHILETPEHNIYLSTRDHGFGLFDPETGIYKQVEIENDIYNSVYQLSYIKDNKLAGICGNGFFTYNLQTKKTNLLFENNRLNTLLIDREYRIWLGSQDGLYMLDIQTNEKKSFYTDNGLVNNYVQSIIQSSDGTVWVSTSNGLSRFTDKGESLSGFNRYDGVITNEFWERSAYISSEGSIFWGGTDGFNILTSQNADEIGHPLIPMFVGFQLFNTNVENGKSYNGNIILKESVTTTQEITLNHNQNFFTLEFSGLNYINPIQTYYRYSLSGIDENEREVQSENGRGFASYTDLAPGTYTFRVRAVDNGKEWSDHYAEIKIIVKAPWWKTPIAYCIYIILFVGALISSIAFYVRWKKRKIFNEQLQNSAADLQILVCQLSGDATTPVQSNGFNMKTLLLDMHKLLEKQKLQNIDTTSTDTTLLSPSDEKFIEKALKYVELNIDNTEYSVEQLSKDIGMERTGLYRKLGSIIGKTPTSFIRSIRLKRAAQFLEEGFTISETADRVGFATSSYLSKCFQEEFGMKPSEYAASLKHNEN